MIDKNFFFFFKKAKQAIDAAELLSRLLTNSINNEIIGNIKKLSDDRKNSEDEE